MSIKSAAENIYFGYPHNPTNQPSMQGAVDLFENVRWTFARVSSLLSDAALSYAPGSNRYVSAGDIVQAEAYLYSVADSAATDHHVTTAGGVKLYVLPGASGYHVDAFGAVGDGVTDDKGAIQAAINAAAAAGGGCVKLGSRQYGVGSQILIDTNQAHVTISGDGAASVLKKIVDGNFNVLRVRGQHIAIKDLCFDGNKTQITSNQNTSLMVYGQNVLIEGVVARNSNRDGIGFVDDAGNNGSAKNVVVANCYVHNNRRVGISCSGLEGFSISGCVIYDNGLEGITLDQHTRRGSVSGCFLQNNNLGDGSAFGIGHIGFDKMEHVIIQGNVFYEKVTGADARPAIRAGNASGRSVDCVIADNAFNGFGNLSYAIDLTDASGSGNGCRRFTISGNNAKNHLGFLKLDGPSSKIVVGPQSGSFDTMPFVTDGGNLVAKYAAPCVSSWSVRSATNQLSVTGNGTSATVVYDVSVDLRSQQPPSINLSTGEITVSVSGVYNMTASAELTGLTGATSGQIEIQVNGVAVSRRKFAFPSTTPEMTFSVSAIEQLLTGDVVRVVVSASGKGADTANIAGRPLGTEFFGSLVH